MEADNDTNSTDGQVITTHNRPRTYWRLWIVLLGIAAGGILFFGITSALISLVGGLTNLSSRCVTDACIQYGAMLRGSVSSAIDPCEDFYGHVCGRWTFSSSVRETFFQKYIDAVAHHNRETFVPTSNQNVAQKAALFFQVCENIVVLNRTEIETVRRLLVDVGLYDPLPVPFTESLLNITLLLNIIWAFDTPLQIIPFVKNNTLHIEVSVGSFFLEHVRGLKSNQEKHQAIFARLQPYFESIHSQDVSFTHVTGLDRKVSYALSHSLSPAPNYTTENIDRIGDFASKLPPDVWRRHLRLYFSDINFIQIRIQDRNFFRHYFSLPDEFSPTDVLIYMRWYMLLELSLMTDWSTFTLWHGGYEAAKKARISYCFQAAQSVMKGSLTAAYVNTHFGGRVLAGIGRLIKEMRQAHSDIFSTTGPLASLRRSEYLADTSVPSFEAVVESNEDVLARFSRKYADMTKDMTRNWRIASAGLRASTNAREAMGQQIAWPTASFLTADFYNPHTLSLLPAFGAMPFYDAQNPFTFKLTGAGSVISEVLATQLLRHVHDWERPATNELEKQLLCLSNSTTQNSSTMHLGAEATTFEAKSILKLILSLRGLLGAYQRSGEKALVSIKNLPGLNGPQLLYVGWCYMYCGEAHGKVLCNEPLRETPEFARVFRCVPSAGMRKANICTAQWFTPLGK